MKTQPHSEKFKRHRKFLLVLPLFALPFLVTTFWALGGGNPTLEIADDNAKLIGTLPSPEIEEKPMDKLSLFEKAKKDSSNRQKQYTQDPYADFFQIKESELENQDIGKSDHGVSPIIESTPMKEQEEKIRQQLDELQSVLDQPDIQPASQKPVNRQKETPIELAGDIDRLEAMMHRMSQRDDEDPEMKQVEDMLEKILDIQHPQRVQDRLREKSREEKGKVFPIHTDTKPLSKKNKPTPSSLDVADDELDYSPLFTQSKQTNGFYGLEEESVSSDDNIFAVPAVIHGEQTLTAGATVKMRLIRDIYVNGMRIPSGSFVFGTCGIQGERLEIAVDGIRHGEIIFPISLTVYDMDAISGIRIPGAITRESFKEGTASAIQGTQFMGFNPSIEAQAANAGIEAAKGLFSKKAKLIRVTVKDTHPVLLVDQNQRHQ